MVPTDIVTPLIAEEPDGQVIKAGEAFGRALVTPDFIEAVLVLKEHGFSNEKIASALSIHPGTVKLICGGRHALQVGGQAHKPVAKDSYDNRRGAKHTKAKVTPQLVDNIYQDHFWRGRKPHHLCKLHSLGAPTMQKILTGAHWVHREGLVSAPQDWKQQNPQPPAVQHVQASVQSAQTTPVNDIQSFVESHTAVERSWTIGSTALDVFVPSLKLGVILDDVKTTSESAGFTRLVRLKEHQALEAEGVTLVRVFSNEWEDRTSLVKSMLLHRLKKTPNKIMARDTVVQEIPVKDATAFLDQNHLQGSVGSKVKLGCMHNGKLVALATFGPQRYGSTEGSFELLRYANLQDHHVVGGFSKILAHFRRHYAAKHLISFADRRWSSGGMYAHNGFKLTRTSSPNYFYFKPEKPNDLFSRVGFQKHKLPVVLKAFDSQKSEVENMLTNGWERIWDCGNLVYEMSLQDNGDEVSVGQPQ